MKKYTVFFALVLFFITHSAMAAKVSQVKNNKVMLSLEGDGTTTGSELFIINPQGKKVAIVRVTQVKGDRAIGDIVKGSVKPGYTTQLKSAGSGSASSSAGSSSSGDSYYDKKLNQRAHTGNSYGVIGGYLMNSMSASFTPVAGGSKVNPSMSGTGFGALGFYDYALSSSFVGRAMVGMEQYNVAGSITTADCSLTTNCSVNLTYLSMYGYGRWNLTQGNYKTWIGGGFGYLYAMGKASTFLKADQISANQIFMFSAGMDIRLSAKTYVPVSLEYGMFPSSDSVKASIIYLRAGYAWNL